LALVILGFPLYAFCTFYLFFGKVNSRLIYFIFLLFFTLLFLSFVLLGNNRLRTLTAAFFVLSMLNISQFPAVYLHATVIPLVTNFNTLNELIIKYPLLAYSEMFFINIIITVSCFLAARWLRNTMLKPPVKLCVLFNLLFVLFTLVIEVWLEDFSKVTSIPFLSTFFMGVFFILILLSSFYIFTRLTKENLSSAAKETEGQLPVTSAQADKYTPFIQQLSRRELEVIEAILAGNVSHKELSSSLNISVNTVKTHLKHIYQTTGVSNIAGLSSLFHGYSSAHPQITP